MRSRVQALLASFGRVDPPLGVVLAGEPQAGGGESLPIHSPIDGGVLGHCRLATPAQAADAVRLASDAFRRWRVVPAPLRGELVRRFGEKVRARKAELAEIITLEVGKITQEALGEVQEVVDVCEFAVGLSRQLHGLTIASERPGHRLMEQWHPLGPVAVVSAFNFPMAVWAWNAALALVCGDSVIWKPSEKTPLSAIFMHALLEEVVREFPEAPRAVSQLVWGDAAVGDVLAASPAVPLVSATGSCRMGKIVAQRVAARLGRSLLELGGNNAAIVAPTADLELTVRAVTFAAVGTCGQRCTSLRRLIVHESRREEMLSRLKAIYGRLPIGDPRQPGTLVGPLIDEGAGERMAAALSQARGDGGKVFGGERLVGSACAFPGGVYVQPAIVEIDLRAAIVREETFAPILYVGSYRDFDEAIEIHNDVPQGLSSSVFTRDLLEGEKFLSPAGSDCGIANVNLGTSGAEIGGAFGGEKETGGGRESGSDSWKNYMRRATNTINYSTALPLAQGIRFEV